MAFFSEAINLSVIVGLEFLKMSLRLSLVLKANHHFLQQQSYRIISAACYRRLPTDVTEWSTLPEHIVSLTTIEAFKNAIITA